MNDFLDFNLGLQLLLVLAVVVILFMLLIVMNRRYKLIK